MNELFISSEIELLDERLGGGFRKRGAYLFAAEKKAGKSSFVRKIIFNLLAVGKKVLLIDTEESEEDILAVMASIAKEKDTDALTEEDLEDTREVMKNMPLVDCNRFIGEFYVEGALSLDVLEAYIKRQKDFGVEVVVFDNVTREGAENSANARMKLMTQLIKLSKKYELLLFVVGHTPSSEVDLLDRQVITRVIETRQFDELLSTTQRFVQRPKDPYGGSATSQFDGVFIIWRPFQYYKQEELRKISYLIVEQIRTSAPFTLSMDYDGAKKLFSFIKPLVIEGGLWKEV